MADARSLTSSASDTMWRSRNDHEFGVPADPPVEKLQGAMASSVRFASAPEQGIRTLVMWDASPGKGRPAL